jgi:hypothetical protein
MWAERHREQGEDQAGRREGETAMKFDARLALVRAFLGEELA